MRTELVYTTKIRDINQSLEVYNTDKMQHARNYYESLRNVFGSEEFASMTWAEKQQLRTYEQEAINDFIDKNLGEMNGGM